MNIKRKCISLFVNRYDIDVENVIKIKEEINNKKYNTGIVFEENR